MDRRRARGVVEGAIEQNGKHRRLERVRRIVTIVMAMAGLALLDIALLDWAGYSGFSISLLWR